MMMNAIIIVMRLIQMFTLLFFQRQLSDSKNLFSRFVWELHQCINLLQIWMPIYVLNIQSSVHYNAYFLLLCWINITHYLRGSFVLLTSNQSGEVVNLWLLVNLFSDGPTTKSKCLFYSNLLISSVGSHLLS